MSGEVTTTAMADAERTAARGGVTSAAGPDRAPAARGHVAAAHPAVQRIDASESSASLRTYIRDLWTYRELTAFLAWRELKIRYKETALGIIWAIAQPLLTAAVLSMIFARVRAVSAGEVPYLLFTLAGLVPWLFFATTVTASTTSFITSQSLVTKIYFPRAVVPMATVLAATIDLAVGLAVVAGTMAWFHVVPGATVVLVPLALLMVLSATLGAALLVGIMTVRFRDLRYVVPFAVQIGMFVTPVFYPVSILHSPWAGLMYLNPVASGLEVFRAGLFGQATPWIATIVGAVGAVVLLAAGLMCARGFDRRLPDLL
jgi:lipopolysaccharide transport system permease protein